MPAILFTKATAAEMGRRGFAKRELNRAMRLAVGAKIPNVNGHCDDYVAMRLLRVRSQLDRLDAVLERAHTKEVWDRLSAASERLTRIEFGLSGRPWPGQRRPGREPVVRQVDIALSPLSLGPAPSSQPVPQPISPPDSAPHSDPKPETPQL